MASPAQDVLALMTRIGEALALAGMALIAGIGLYTVGDVVMRYVFNSPLPGAVDIVTYGLAGGVALVMPHSVVTGRHVAVTLLVNAVGRRVRVVLDAVVLTIVALFFSVFTWRLAVFAAERFAVGDTMWILGWPVWPVWGLVTAGFGTATLFALCMAALAWTRPFLPLSHTAASVPEASE